MMSMSSSTRSASLLAVGRLRTLNSMETSPTVDIAVVGGGIAGLCAAVLAARQGYDVALFEPGMQQNSAAWTSAGMHAPLAELMSPELLDDAARAMEFNRSFFGTLGHNLDTVSGVLVPLYAGADVSRRFNDLAASTSLELLPVDQWPNEPPQGAEQLARIPAEFAVDPRMLLNALESAAMDTDRVTVVQQRVADIRRESRGICINTGDQRQMATNAVLATGWQAPPVENLARPWGVPVRGILLRMDLDNTPPCILYDHLDGQKTYVVPGTGGVRIGSTAESGATHTNIDDGEVRELIERASRLWPPVRDGQLTDASAGIRPSGSVADPDRFVVDSAMDGKTAIIKGLFRNGILFGPTAAHLALQQIGIELT